VFNTLTEHGLQDAVRIGRSAEIGKCARKRTASRVMVASRLKVSFEQMAVLVPKIFYYDGTYRQIGSMPRTGFSYSRGLKRVNQSTT
jgi:hypothetical protein